ncbi:sigma-54-dependent Fis family transcriptional regulator [Fusobacterium sp. IOR10]|uniref:sigma-54 interaction domain-containing protein n=1 Tax=Fusobacterium sp. IOR10 TaxID=2665157 RepID=UPI0013D14FAA|nr:sigma 54-interacting transcriptional regulator [Fusobacterium sp. IOR10]
MHHKNYNLNREIFEQLSSMTDDGFIVVDRAGNVIHINEKYCNFLGTTEEEALGKSILNIIPNSMMLDVMEKKYCEECVIQTYILGKEAEKGAIVSRSYVEDENGNVIAGVAQVKFRIQTLDVAQKLMKNYVELKYYREEYVKNNKLNLSFKTMVGDSDSFMKVKKIGIKASKTNFPVFLSGSTGTGKEVLAKAIHLNSDRKNHPMVSINCGAVPENLLESELFGYEEGAFTGAKKGGKKGKFLIASGGTLFLDEIGDMPLGMQVKLLRVLQENEIDPVGSIHSIPINVRIIAATKKNIEKMVELGEFREDLYYRLNVIKIELPNLNERKSDILKLADYFLNKLNVEYKTVKGFSKEVKECLESFKWPGNIRELDNVIKSAYAISDDLMIKLIDLPPKLSFYNREKQIENRSGNLVTLVNEYEKNIILNVLNSSKNCKEASEKLGIHRSALYKKIKKYEIQ